MQTLDWDAFNDLKFLIFYISFIVKLYVGYYKVVQLFFFFGFPRPVSGFFKTFLLLILIPEEIPKSDWPISTALRFPLCISDGSICMKKQNENECI